MLLFSNFQFVNNRIPQSRGHNLEILINFLCSWASDNEFGALSHGDKEMIPVGTIATEIEDDAGCVTEVNLEQMLNHIRHRSPLCCRALRLNRVELHCLSAAKG